MEHHNDITGIEGEYIQKMFRQRSVKELKQDLQELYNCYTSEHAIEAYKSKHRLIIKPKTVVCDVCGKKYETDIRRNCKHWLCSSKCRTKFESEHKKSKEKSTKKDNQKEILSVESEARKRGMTYGQYVAMLYMRDGK